MAYIFLSYAHEDIDLAQKLFFALSNLRHQVFFDKASLQVGNEYNFNIIDNIRRSDLSVLLLSPDYFSENSYCKTELKIIQTNWPAPAGKVFPVMARETTFDIIPNYISSVTILKSHGNLVAEIVQTIQDQLLGFKSTGTVASKLKSIEIREKIQQLEMDWNEQRKKYMIKQKDNYTRPTTTAAIVTLIVFSLFGAVGYFFFTKTARDFFGIWPMAIPVLMGLIAFFFIINRASKFTKAEKNYMDKRMHYLRKCQMTMLRFFLCQRVFNKYSATQMNVMQDSSQ